VRIIYYIEREADCLRLARKIALITGGTGELGRAVTKVFLDEGADVVVTYHNDAEFEAYRRSFPDVPALKGDLSKEKDVARIFGELLARKGTIDVLCNLIGGYMPKKDITDLAEKEWDFMFSLNVKTCFFCCRGALKIMKIKQAGRIVNVSAMAGLVPEAGRGAYGISKAAISTLTSIAGEETKLYPGGNVTVNAIAPSILITESNRRSATESEMAGWVPLTKAAALIAFLASDDAASINGQTIRIYGGV
jgi:NAD(P)-dependent dehydrogenase (short-subunit alcohol dehydrogenase family)